MVTESPPMVYVCMYVCMYVCVSVSVCVNTLESWIYSNSITLRKGQSSLMLTRSNQAVHQRGKHPLAMDVYLLGRGVVFTSTNIHTV